MARASVDLPHPDSPTTPSASCARYAKRNCLQRLQAQAPPGGTAPHAVLHLQCLQLQERIHGIAPESCGMARSNDWV